VIEIVMQEVMLQEEAEGEMILNRGQKRENRKKKPRAIM
jgi:hypothetical protein